MANDSQIYNTEDPRGVLTQRRSKYSMCTAKEKLYKDRISKSSNLRIYVWPAVCKTIGKWLKGGRRKEALDETAWAIGMMGGGDICWPAQ